MPVYEYYCDRCKREFEIERRITEERRDECPYCGQISRRVLSAAAFVLKGSGWAKDKYSS